MDRETFIRAVCADPADDTVRLAFADWCDENGDQDRAKFIRVQCEIARRGTVRCARRSRHQNPEPLGWYKFTKRCRCEGCSLRRREYNASKRHSVWEWCRRIPVSVVMKYERGFVAKIQVPLSTFTEWAKAIFDAHPIERVVLTGVVRDGIVFRTSNGHYNDIPREMWDALRLPTCPEKGKGRGTHAHMTENELSRHLVAYGRRLAGLPVLLP